MAETIKIDMVTTEISPEKIIDGKVVLAVTETKPVMTVTRTQEASEKYTLTQINQTIANIEVELANVQARLNYQKGLKAQLEAVK